MMTGVEVVTWPSISDVVRQAGISPTRVRQLIGVGRLRAVNTRLGYLIDPDSLAQWQAYRAARKARTA